MMSLITSVMRTNLQTCGATAELHQDTSLMIGVTVPVQARLNDLSRRYKSSFRLTSVIQYPCRALCQTNLLHLIRKLMGMVWLIWNILLIHILSRWFWWFLNTHMNPTHTPVPRVLYQMSCGPRSSIFEHFTEASLSVRRVTNFRDR